MPQPCSLPFIISDHVTTVLVNDRRRCSCNVHIIGLHCAQDCCCRNYMASLLDMTYWSHGTWEFLHQKGCDTTSIIKHRHNSQSNDNNWFHYYIQQLWYSIPQEICTRFLLCCALLWLYIDWFPISIRVTSLALWQSNDCPSASKATLMNMDKYFMWIHYERLHNHNKAKHNKTVCIFLGIYCSKIAAKPVVGSGSDHNTFSGKIYFYPHRKRFIKLPIHCID